MVKVVSKKSYETETGWIFYVAGIQHHDLDLVIDEISKGDDLDLVMEPSNTYDSNAVRIEFGLDGVMLGYVPGKISYDVSRIIKELTVDRLSCRVVIVDKDKTPWQRLYVEIEVLYDEDEDEDESEEESL